MADTPSLLGYQTSYELRLFDLSTNSQQMGDYRMACFWARQHAIFVGCENIPAQPVFSNNSSEVLAQYQDWYGKLMGASLKNVAAKVEKIRAIYGKSNDIPKILKKKLQEEMI